MVKVRNKRTGEIVEVPDQPGGLQRVGPVNTMRPLQEQGAQLGNQRTQQQINIDNTMFPLQVKKAQADAAKAQAEATKAKMEGGLDPQKLANIRAVQSQIDRLGELYMAGPGKTKGLAGILDYIPTGKNAQFDTAGAGLGEVGLAAFRVPGVGSQSDTELRAFIDANRPSSWDQDARIKEKMRNLQNRLDQTYSAYGIKRQSSKKQSGVVDFNDLPE